MSQSAGVKLHRRMCGTPLGGGVHVEDCPTCGLNIRSTAFLTGRIDRRWGFPYRARYSDTVVGIEYAKGWDGKPWTMTLEEI